MKTTIFPVNKFFLMKMYQKVFYPASRIYGIHSLKLIFRKINSSNICLQLKYPHSAPK